MSGSNNGDDLNGCRIKIALNAIVCMVFAWAAGAFTGAAAVSVAVFGFFYSFVHTINEINDIGRERRP